MTGFYTSLIKEQGFQAAAFLNKRRPENIWNVFINFSVSVYDGLPNNIILDANHSFLFLSSFKIFPKRLAFCLSAIEKYLINESLKMNHVITIFCIYMIL